MRRIDMHIHTTASDGMFTPVEVVSEAVKKNISVISVSDHDSVKNVKETSVIAVKNGIKCVNAMEATSVFNGKEFHILGYNFDIDHPELRTYIENTAIIRYRRELDIVKEASKIFDGLSLNELQKFAKLEVSGGFLSFNYLKMKGKVNGIFDFIKIKNQMHLPDTYHFYEAERIITMFQKIGAVIVLAHPSYNFPGNVADHKLLDMFKTMGIHGLECYSPYNSLPKQIAYYRDYCAKNHLIISGGSDCHGPLLERKMGTPYADETLCDIISLLGV